MAKKLSEVLPEDIMCNLRQRWGLEPDDPSEDERVDNMDLYGIVEEYFDWLGIIGYGSEIIDTVIGTILALKECGEDEFEGYGYKLVKEQ